MPVIDGPLDAAIDAWKAKTATKDRSRRAFRAARRKALATPDMHPLQRQRLNFRGVGLSREELSERSTVSVDVIKRIENRSPEAKNVSDASWARLLLGLGLTHRSQIDEKWVG